MPERKDAIAFEKTLITNMERRVRTPRVAAIANPSFDLNLVTR
jgi:hypothetical protein